MFHHRSVQWGLIDQGLSTGAGSWSQALWDLLQTDDEACLGLIRSAGGVDGTVELVEGSVTTQEALAYARTLSELGYLTEAWDIFTAVVQAAFAWCRLGAGMNAAVA